MNDADVADLRSTSPQTALRQLEALYASIDYLGLRDMPQEGESEVREMWIRLKERYGVRINPKQ